MNKKMINHSNISILSINYHSGEFLVLSASSPHLASPDS